jgi:hypothetical protein
MKRNEISEKAHKNAVEHGFWDIRKSNEHCLMLIYLEVAELVEADRKSLVADRQNFNEWMSSGNPHKHAFGTAFEKYIKSTLEDEFADIYIRLADLAWALRINFDKMLPCRYFRAFYRFSFTENAFALIKGLSKEPIPIEKRIQFGMSFIEDWAKQQRVNLEWHITKKMMYNQTREVMHGNKY